MKKLLILIFLVTISYAEYYPNALFAEVDGVAHNDTLNVRVAPDYHSKKIDALPQYAFVGVDFCKKVGKSTWCKIFPIAQRDYFKAGWVNARYLKFDNDGGYVIVDGKPNCDYALRCKNRKCEVVTGYITNPNTDYITSLKIEWIDRIRLKGAGRFEAMPNEPEATGYCTSDHHIYDFLDRQKKIKQLGEGSQKAFEMLSILRHFDTMGIDGFLNSIHPKKGVVMTWNTYFGAKEDIVFTKSDIKRYINNPSKKIFWGYTDGKGDEVYLSFHDYISKLTKPIDISKIKKLENLKGFHCSSKSECKGYEFFWIDKKLETKRNDYWQGLVIIVEKYHDKWYVVGLLRDRWTI